MEAAVRFIHFLRLYRNIPESDAEIISAAFRDISFKSGAVLLEAGTIPSEIFFVLEGVLKITVLNQNGNTVTYYFIRENFFCTILSHFNAGSVSEENIVAATDARVLCINKKTLEALYVELPYLRQLIGGIMQEMLLHKINVKNSYMGLDASERYNKFITQQSDIALRVPLADIASYLGVTPQSLSRIRKNIS